MSNRYRPINLAGAHWIERGRVASFNSSRPGYGVEVVATGEVLARDGQPAAWRTKSTAQIIADHADGMSQYRPVTVYRSVLEAMREARR